MQRTLSRQFIQVTTDSAGLFAPVQRNRLAPIALSYSQNAGIAVNHSTPISTAPCPACRFSDGLDVKRGVVEEQTVTVRACGQCGAMYANPRIAQRFEALPAALYQNDWASFDPGIVAYQYARMIEHVRAEAPKLLRAPHEATMLDIGCGPGYLLAHARAHGWKVRGADPWRELAAWGGKYLKLDIAGETWEQADIAADSVDIIAVLDVLGLVVDPVAFLAKCKRALKPGGVVHISVWNGRVLPADGAAFFVGAHQMAFTPEALTHVLCEAGFRRNDIECRTVGGTANDQEIVVTVKRAIEARVSWSDIADEVEDDLRPMLDRKLVDMNRLTENQRFWRDNGYLILERFIPDELVDRYIAVRSKIKDPLGWHSPSAYEDVEEMRDLALYGPLAKVTEELIGKPLGLHLVLTGWKSTTRDWHQDDYLNPPEVNSHYMALWFALDTISPDAGPFEFVPGSHRWPLVRQSKIKALLPPGKVMDDSWPWLSEEILSPFFEAEIDKRQVEVKQFLGRKGDVLLWHSNLLHRGSLPRDPSLERRSLIGHLTAVGHRNDMHATKQHKGGGIYFDLKTDRAAKTEAATQAEQAAKGWSMSRLWR